MKQPRILIHLHVYYPEQVDYFVKKLGNINGVKADFFITTIKENLPALKPLLRFNPEVKVVANKGYDILPFIKILQKVELKNYDYILKLHTKRTRDLDYFNRGRYFTGSSWRNLLVDSLLGSPEIFAENIAILEGDKKLGLIGSWYCIRTEKIGDIRNKFGISTYTGDAKEITYIAGTMFLARAKPYEQIFKWGIDDDSFETTPDWVHSRTFAHLAERLMGFVITMAGYEIKGTGAKNIRFEISQFLARILRIIFYTKVTDSGKRIVKIFKIPVYHRRVK